MLDAVLCKLAGMPRALDTLRRGRALAAVEWECSRGLSHSCSPQLRSSLLPRSLRGLCTLQAAAPQAPVAHLPQGSPDVSRLRLLATEHLLDRR